MLVQFNLRVNENRKIRSPLRVRACYRAHLAFRRFLAGDISRDFAGAGEPQNLELSRRL